LNEYILKSNTTLASDSTFSTNSPIFAGSAPKKAQQLFAIVPKHAPIAAFA
jgi:hypothetical protein